jgi:Tol biopolymer transport system component/predicted Ser/Thr protein kinase
MPNKTEITMVGKVLAQYQICEKLGKGGMGVVWKARDTHLDRFVALKTLPADSLADPDRKRRSVQEAKAASALNHPNIVHVYDVAEADGVHFISMEYVPGKTLEQLIGRKGLPLNEALKYAVQIADALALAHSVGIVHRDLKPSNIIVSESGHVKVLDFGIAKLTEITTGEFGETAPMRAPDASETTEGVVFGTAAYMSPEQAEGKKIDARSDIFSFGSMLYEMVTGRQAFHGDSRLSTLYAVLKEEPGPASAAVADIPRDLEKVIGRCLRKDPERRFQHMADVKVALEEVKEDTETGKLTGVAGLGGPSRRKSRAMWALAGTAVLLLMAIAFGLWFPRIRSHPAPRTVPLTSYPGYQLTPAFSPDGKQVAFAWDGENGDNFDIYIKLVDAGTPLRLTTNPEFEYAPTWSPDGHYIAFCRTLGAHAEIWMIPALGGVERKVGEAAVSSGTFPGLSWSPDGKFLALADKPTSGSSLGLFLLSIETGDKRMLTSPPHGYIGDLRPHFSPDGKSLAFIRASYDTNNAIYLLSVSASGEPQGEPRRLTPDQPLGIGGFDWTADGRSIIFSVGQRAGANLWTIAVSSETAERLAGAGENATDISISRTENRLIYARYLTDSNIWRTPGPNSSNRKGAATRFIASTQPDLEPQFSPDGRKIVFTSTRSGVHSIWVSDSDGLNPVDLTSFNGATVGSPRWSPDGRWIAFDSPQAANWDIYVISSEGGPVRRLTTGPSNNARPSWSRDGRWVYFGSNRSGDWQVWKAPSQGGAALQVTHKGGREAFQSFDGNFVYYAKLGSAGIWKVPVGGGEETLVLDHGWQGLWALSKEGIYFTDRDNSVSSVLKYYRFATRQTRIVKEFPKDTKLDWNSTVFSVSPDGRWILYSQLDQAGCDLMLMENYR